MSNTIRDVRWPSLVLVGVLFVLSLLAPRQWRYALKERPKQTPSADHAKRPFDTLAKDWARETGFGVQPASQTVAQAPATNPTAETDVALGSPRREDISTHVAHVEPTSIAATNDSPPTETDAHPAVTGLPATVPAAEPASPRDVAHAAEPSTAPTPAEQVAPDHITGEPNSDPAALAIQPSGQQYDPAQHTNPHDVPHPIPSDLAHGATHGSAWPMPGSTIEQLHALTHHDATRGWAGEMSCVLDDLRRGVDLPPEQFAKSMAQLRTLLASGAILEAQLATQPALSSQVTRARLAIERRLDAWHAVYALNQVAGGDRLASRNNGADITYRDPASIVKITPSPEAALADEAVSLLDDIESYEASPTPHTARKIALAARQLVAHRDAAAQQFGQHVDANYRNANLRVAVHGDLLNRFLPQPTESAGDVNDFVAGVPVHGTQRTRTRLLLRLLPDNSRIRLGLEAHGEVDSDTSAQSGPATVFTTGETRFLARKLVLFDERRWNVFPAVAAARNESSLSGMRTDFDPFPILNSLVHSVVRSKHEERRWSAEREVEDRVSQQAQSQLDQQADVRFAELTNKATQTLVEPLKRMALDPTPVALATTDDRVIFRYRLAGPEQLGGHTPRPRAPGDSWLSVQLHESSINNALANLELAGRTFELRALYEAVATRLGRPDIKVPDDVPENVKVTFAADNPLVVRLIDNSAQVTLRLARLEVEKQTWTDLNVIATYEPETNGLDAIFSRNGPIRLSGKNLNTRSNIVLRGVFSKMFTRNRQVHLLPEKAMADARLADLAVNQLVVHDGWVGLAIGPKRAAGQSITHVSTEDAESAARPTEPPR